MTNLPYGRFCQDSDVADERRGVLVPPDRLPCVTDGRARLQAALRLPADLAAPGALDATRRAVAEALDLIPQSGRDQHCHEYRRRSGTTVCSVRTSARGRGTAVMTAVQLSSAGLADRVAQLSVRAAAHDRDRAATTGSSPLSSRRTLPPPHRDPDHI